MARPTKGNGGLGAGGLGLSVSLSLSLSLSLNCSMINPVEFVPRMGKLGLGAAPKPEVMPAKKRPRKPGDTDKKASYTYIYEQELFIRKQER